jgi:3-phosphoshikimate 1-carboxyvinyltransferase
MSSQSVSRATRPLTGSCHVPGDKSISHRAAIFAMLAGGTSSISGFSKAGDCASTLTAISALGARVHRSGDEVVVEGRSDFCDSVPGPLVVDCGRSGTTMRLLAGVVAALPIEVQLTGHPQLLARPMERVAAPLRQMGAAVETAVGGRAPLTVRGGDLHGICFQSPVASAQVKSAVLLAGLSAAGRTEVLEPIPTRDHTERMLEAMGAAITVTKEGKGLRVVIRPSALHPVRIVVPGDASAAAVIATAAALVRGSDVSIESVLGNPTRSGLLDVLRRMGAVVEVIPVTQSEAAEPAVSWQVRQAPLRSTSVVAEEIPLLVDELPLVGLLATQATGTTVVRGAAELRVKESDRIRGLVEGLVALGADVGEFPDGFSVTGPTPLHGGVCDSLTDHRLAMTFALAGLVASRPVTVLGMEFVEDSFPGFQACLGSLL